jgi:hypothetical protein
MLPRGRLGLSSAHGQDFIYAVLRSRFSIWIIVAERVLATHAHADPFYCALCVPKTSSG